jgi:hypothetical protein
MWVISIARAHIKTNFIWVGAKADLSILSSASSRHPVAVELYRRDLSTV